METVLAIFVALVVVVISYFKWTYSYWKRRNMAYVEPQIPYGNIESPFSRKNTFGVRLQSLYRKLQTEGHKHGGFFFFATPKYIPIHPEYIKNVMQRDFNYFVERGFYYNEKDDPLSANLFTLGGQRWRNLRTKLTPTFTSGKMKMMFETLLQCGVQMQEAMINYCGSDHGVDIKEILACFTTDVIGSCAFGLECNSFKSPDAEFRKYGKKIFDPVSKFRLLLIAFGFAKPDLSRRLGIRFFNKDATKFFAQVVEDTVKFRETNNFIRKDMLQILIDLKKELKNGTQDSGLTMQELAAQAFIFFAAGFETSSTTMTFCLYELAMHPDIQQRVRDEVNQVLAQHDGKISYDALMDMKYMSQVIDETLRKYPPLSFITRTCVKDYKVPETDVVLKKGMDLFVSVLGLHHNTDYYPNPEKFDPERFTDENVQKRPPFTYMPFGEGPRTCIGLRFGLMQTKVGLTLLLKHFKFSLNKETVTPIEMDPYSFILTSKRPIFLNVEKVE